MKLSVIAIGTRMPSWVEEGCQEYCKRLPKDFALQVVEIPMAQRGKTTDLKKAIKKEGDACLQSIPKKDYVIALDVLGKSFSTERMAEKLEVLKNESYNVSFLIGGPDGLSDGCRKKANEIWSLSTLTMPHPIVRVILVEQLYRVWSLLNNHPYHRGM